MYFERVVPEIRSVVRWKRTKLDGSSRFEEQLPDGISQPFRDQILCLEHDSKSLVAGQCDCVFGGSCGSC